MEYGRLRAQVSSLEHRLEQDLEAVKKNCPGRDSIESLSSEVESIKGSIAELSWELGNLREERDILEQRLEDQHQDQERDIESLRILLKKMEQKHEQDLEAERKTVQEDMLGQEQANEMALWEKKRFSSSAW